jgi:hypothetical protein
MPWKYFKLGSLLHADTHMLLLNNYFKKLTHSLDILHCFCLINLSVSGLISVVAIRMDSYKL